MVTSPLKETAQQVQPNPSGQVPEAGNGLSEDTANSDVIQPIPATSVPTGKSKCRFYLMYVLFLYNVVVG